MNLHGRPVAVTITRDRLWKNRYNVALCYIIKHPEHKESIWHTEIKAYFDHNETGAKIVAESYSMVKKIPIFQEIKRGNIVTPEQFSEMISFENRHNKKYNLGVKAYEL